MPAPRGRSYNAWLIYSHPELVKCLRIVTVRELARAQGFPDDFVFKSLNDVITVGVALVPPD